jgi:hypothetical protein
MKGYEQETKMQEIIIEMITPIFFGGQLPTVIQICGVVSAIADTEQYKLPEIFKVAATLEILENLGIKQKEIEKTVKTEMMNIFN